jgi:hypothetical protein
MAQHVVPQVVQVGGQGGLGMAADASWGADDARAARAAAAAAMAQHRRWRRGRDARVLLPTLMAAARPLDRGSRALLPSPQSGVAMAARLAISERGIGRGERKLREGKAFCSLSLSFRHNSPALENARPGRALSGQGRRWADRYDEEGRAGRGWQRRATRAEEGGDEKAVRNRTSHLRVAGGQQRACLRRVQRLGKQDKKVAVAR